MMWGGWGGYGGWGPWVGGVFMLVFWAAVITGLVFLIRYLVRLGRERGEGSSSSALEILKRRYAQGEIDKKEFEDKRKDLT